ncbi:Zinc finger CCCH domain-containing protein 32 [Striga hermonthica]|uniref:Zinc finger CCCH domain-containing protein 32 n=1 Tax=Striga hermonthica TaxID=68872 RepID=A0A9N7P312_STRHE|nr:Zinc finger CCCH domain-containing protein 32 [Striga hermonthica]
MDSYSGTNAMEAVPGGETGLEGRMWQLGLRGGPEPYPERPGEPDCIYYLRTGFCGYGNRCRFNHPRDRSLTIGAFRAGGGEYPERVGQPVCQHYMRTGTCKFSVSCKYNHPKLGIGTLGPVTLNIYGYPLRPGEKECSYYGKTGHCKFGLTCKFHHPQPLGVSVPVPSPSPSAGLLAAPVPTLGNYLSGPSPSVQSSQQYGVIQGNWPVVTPAMLPGSYVPGSYGPVLLPPGVVPVSGWTPYAAPVSPVASQSVQPAVAGSSIYGITKLSPSAAAYPGQYISVTSSGGPSSSSHKELAHPERPGKPKCQHFLRTGECKFGATCKYHHPPEWSEQKTTFVLSPMGLPLRPGAPLCSHYAKNGVCKFGPTCRFDHPMRGLSYSPSASSLTDMPVAPYPVSVESTHATLALSDLRLSGLNKDTFCLSQMSPMSSTSASITLGFSSDGPVSQTGISSSRAGDLKNL